MHKFLPVVSLLLATATYAQKPLLVDTHNDALSAQIISGADLGKEQQQGNFDLVRARRGGLGGQVFSIWCTDTLGGQAHYFATAIREIDSLNALVARYPQEIELVHNASGLKKAARRHRLAALIGVEGGHMIENRADLLDSLISRGMIYLTLTWNHSSAWASSAHDERLSKDPSVHFGLSDFGRQVVRTLNEKGVMVDVSHVGEKTFWDVLQITTRPVIASHSCAYHLDPHPRNLTDDQLKAIAKNGGVVFVNFYSAFLDSSYLRKKAQFFARHEDTYDSLSLALHDHDLAETRLYTLFAREADELRPPLGMLIRHIDYIRNMIGSRHVGIGADFDGAESYPMGINSVADYPKVFMELKKLGYSHREIRNIAGKNFIRVLRANGRK